MITLKQPFGACSQMFQILIANYTSGEIFVVLRSWAVRCYLRSQFEPEKPTSSPIIQYKTLSKLKLELWSNYRILSLRLVLL